MNYLIDGHNLIAHMPDITLGEENDEAKLVNRLAGFASRRKVKRCTVIFDNGLPGGESTLSKHSVRVVFAASHHTNADSLIKRRLSKLNNAKDWTVVSSDRDILSTAQRYNVNSLRAGEFVALMRRQERPQVDIGEHANPAISADHVEEMYALFMKNDPENNG